MTMALCPIYQGNKWDKLSDDIIIDEYTKLYCKALKIDIEGFSASQEFAERVEAIVFCTERSFDDIEEISHEIAAKYDLPYGIALPAISNTNGIRQPILARGTSFSHVGMFERATEYAQRLESEGKHIRNSWETLGDKSVSIVNTTNGPMALWEYHAGNRVRKYLNGLQARTDSPMTAESEEAALQLLKTKVTPSQYRCYMLNGAFPERSKRSDIYYFFRKGLPVIATSFHNYPGGRILCCLCLHPYGYYENTHAGVMCPTDEVIAQLLLMRANEHKFWAKSGQWRASDIRSGL